MLDTDVTDVEKALVRAAVLASHVLQEPKGACSIPAGARSELTPVQEYMLLQVIRASEMRAVAAVELKRFGLTMCIVTPSRTYYFRARDANETYAWIDAVNRIRAEDAEARSGALPQQLQGMHMHGLSLIHI